jgi:hypothetical protein
MLAAQAPATSGPPPLRLRGHVPCFDYFVRPDALTTLGGEIVPSLGRSSWEPGSNGNSPRSADMGLGARTRMLSEGWIFVPHTIGDEVEFSAFGRPRRGRDFAVSHYVEVAERYEDGLLVAQIYHDAWSRPVALGATVVWETDPAGRLEFLVALRKRFIGELSEYQIRSALRPRLEAIQALTGMGEPNFSRAQEIRAHLAHIPRKHRTGDLLGMVKRAGLKDLDLDDPGPANTLSTPTLIAPPADEPPPRRGR